MSYARKGRSPSPHVSVSPGRGGRSRSLSRSRRSHSRSRSRDSAAVENPGNNLYVTGLSTRVTTADIEKFFGNEGKVTECHLVTDPRTKESRGFAFVTMENVEAAECCIKYLNRSVLEGRLITVEKDKIAGDLVATHLADIKIEILIQETGEEDHAPQPVEEDRDPLMTTEETITQTHARGKGIPPCLPGSVGTPDKSKSNCIASMIHPSNYLLI